MSRFGKPDATGRSSGKLTTRQRKVFGPPKDEPWVWLTRELMASDAWRARSVNCIRFLEFLLTEHMNHAGRENGNLMATYDQLVSWGMPRSEISLAIDEAEFLGLVRCQRGGRWADSNQPSIYRLTFFSDRSGGHPTNEWKPITLENARRWRRKNLELKKARREWRKKTEAGFELPNYGSSSS